MLKLQTVVLVVILGAIAGLAQANSSDRPPAAPGSDVHGQTRVIDWKAPPAGFAPLTMHERTQLYFKSIVGIPALLRVGVGSGLAQWEDDPREWGHDGDGFARRFGTSLAGNTTKQTASFALGVILKEDDRYFRSPDRHVPARIGYAAASPFFARSPAGTMRPAFARIAGVVAGGMVSNAWQPDRVATVGEGFKRAGFSLAYDALGNLFREFWSKRK